MFKKITIKRPRKKKIFLNNINEELQLLAESLGIISLRDKDKSCFRIFITLLQAAKEEKSLSSDELAAITNLSRATVIHHLNNLINAGIVTSNKNKYALIEGNLKETIEDINKKINQTMNELKELAEKIDKEIGL